MKEFVGNYTIVNKILDSAVCSISVVQFTGSQQQYLLKTFKSDNSHVDSAALLFKHEYDIISCLHHPNIIPLLGIHTSNAIPSLVYPWEKGKTLAQSIVEEEIISTEESVWLIIQVLEALEYIHRRHLIYCDVHPSNIYISETKGALLLNFNHTLSDDEIFQLPDATLIGTPPYVSIEQTGFTDLKIDVRSDTFCTAMILYQLLGKQLPFGIKDQELHQVIDLLLKAETTPLKNVSSLLNAILIKALKPSPEDRYQTAAGLIHDLQIAHMELGGHILPHFVLGKHDDIMAVNRTKIFVGRDEELTLLQRAYEDLLNGQPSSFLFYGKSGIGKSECILNFKAQASQNTLLFSLVKCHKLSIAQPYTVYRQIIMEMLARINTLSFEEQDRFRALLNNKLQHFSAILYSIIPELKNYFYKIQTADRIEKEKEAARITHACSCLLQMFGEFKQCILAIDDVQWIDHSSFTIITTVNSHLYHTILILTYRSDKPDQELFCHSENLRKIGIKHVIGLHPFAMVEIKELLQNRFGALSDIDTITEILVRRTDGSPFTIAEVIRYLVNHAIIYPTSEGWHVDLKQLNGLPSSFDDSSLILNCLNPLTDKEKQFLTCASIIESKFNASIIEKLCSFTSEATVQILNKLDKIGILARHAAGRYSFHHDKIKDTIYNHISETDKLVLNEKLANIYESMIVESKDFLFSAAECYLKSKNIKKAAHICYDAALHAFEKTAFDLAIKYFKALLLILNQCQRQNIETTIDTIVFQLHFGNVLMLTGRNIEALQILKKLADSNKITDPHTLIELHYKIGSIYHNMGDFDKSGYHFHNLLTKLSIRIPSNHTWFFLTGLNLVFRQLFIPFTNRLFLKSSPCLLEYTKVKILNKLSHSLYFSDTIRCFYIHFKAINLADRLKNSFEKIESYTLHGVPAYNLFLKKRAFFYLHKSLSLALQINRKDAYAQTQNYLGIVHYYRANWRESEEILRSSIRLYHSLGDTTSQGQPLEHLWRIELLRGNIEAAKETIHTTVEMCKKIKDKHFLMTSLAALHFINALQNQKCNKTDEQHIESFMQQTNSYLSYTHVGIFLLQADIVQGKYLSAFKRIKLLLSTLKGKNFNLEYNVPVYTLACELLIFQSLPKEPSDTIRVLRQKTSRRLFYSSLLKIWYASLSYPAYRGIFSRYCGWLCVHFRLKHLAILFFTKSIKHFHTLDMKYEKAKSHRDFGFFLEQCNKPGESRDHFLTAYMLFNACGAPALAEAIQSKIPPEKQTIPKERNIQNTKSLSRINAIQQLRFDTLYDISAHLTDAEDLHKLFRQILNAMLKATGAQYAWLFLENNQTFDSKRLCIDSNGTMHRKSDIPYSRKILRQVREQKKAILIRDVSAQYALTESGDDTARINLIKSVLCIPIIHHNNYLGCVYLGNNAIAGLFSEESKKIAQIFASHVGTTLENAYLIGENRRLIKNLRKKVKEQTKDIQEKNNQLVSTNLKLVDSERMRKILTDTIVHDIKNYAGSIEHQLQFLMKKFSQEDLLKQTISYIQNSCNDILNLSLNLLDLGKFEENRLKPLRSQVFFETIEKIVADELNKARVIFEEKNIRISLMPAPTHYSLYVDINLFGRIIQNLLSNAGKYTPRNGQVVISLDSIDSVDILHFSSSGDPIPAHERTIIFDKYSGSGERRTQYSKGLGLFFCKLVAQAHNGKIWLESDERGNHFHISFQKKLIEIPV